MPIPPIPAYPMPDEDEVPVSRAPWRPDAGRSVLLVHDMQQYFVAPFDRDGDPLRALLANIGRLRRTARDLGVPVVYTAQPGDMDRAQRGLLYDFWGPGMSADPEHRAIVPALAPSSGDVVLTKWRYSAFHRSRLASLMRARGRDQLVVCGVYAHVGCLMTACDAFTRGIQPFLAADAVADFSRAEHDLALDYVAGRCAVPLTTARLVEALRGSGDGTGPAAAPDQVPAGSGRAT